MVILEGRNVTRRFGGITAVDSIDFELMEGEILGLIGPNGAGKTTLLNLISGVFPVSSGTLRFGGMDITRLKPHNIAHLGVARTFQVVKPFRGMTLKENVAIGALFGKAGTSYSIAEAMRASDEILDIVGLKDLQGMSVEEITSAQRKRLELARALAMKPVILLLDEVMAGLNPTEINMMMKLVKQINSNGISILIIEHVMKAVMGISDRVMVLHHGQKLAVGGPEEVANDPAVIRAYLGHRYRYTGDSVKSGSS